MAAVWWEYQVNFHPSHVQIRPSILICLSLICLIWEQGHSLNVDYKTPPLSAVSLSTTSRSNNQADNPLTCPQKASSSPLLCPGAWVMCHSCHFVSSRRPLIISHHHRRKKGEYSSKILREKDHIQITLITVCCYNCFCLITVVVNLLLCLVCRLDFFIGIYGIGKNRSVYGVHYFPWCQASVGSFGTYPPGTRGATINRKLPCSKFSVALIAWLKNQFLNLPKPSCLCSSNQPAYFVLLIRLLAALWKPVTLSAFGTSVLQSILSPLRWEPFSSSGVQGQW